MSSTTPQDVAVVTGGGGQLGRDIALALAGRGVPVALTGRTAASLDKTMVAVEAAGGRALALPGDVRDEAHVETVFSATADEFGACSVLIHAAGTHGTPVRLADASLDEWEFVSSTNLRSTFLCSRAAVRQMVPAKRGAIVLVATAGVLRGTPLSVAYTATKSGFVGFARSLAAEVGVEGIRVNVLSPGSMPGAAMFREILPGFAAELGMSEDDVVPMLQSSSAMRRVCTPKELASTALFLALDATAMTGQNVVADCGLSN